MNTLSRITTIEQLAAKYSNSERGFALINYYKASLPVYRVNSELILQRKKELGLIQEYCLKFIDVQAKTIKHLSNFLGLAEKVIERNILELHQLDMVKFDFKKKEISLTDKGREAIEKNNLIVPECIDYTFTIDALTGEYKVNESLDKLDKIKNDTFVIPTKIISPNKDNIEFKEIKSLIDMNKKLQISSYIDGDLLNINNIDTIEKYYKRMNILVFKNETDEYILQVYDKNKRCSEYENILLQMIDEKFQIIPTVEKWEDIDNSINDKYTSIIDEAKLNNLEVSKIKKNIKSLENDVDENKLIEVESDEEFESKTLRIAELEAELEKERQRLFKIPTILNTYEHRPLLIDSLRNAKKQVVIVSPWIKATATDYNLRLEIENALKRNVNITICYGITNETEKEVQFALKYLYAIKQKKNYSNKLNIVKLGNTHEKVLICDEDYVVITSFNWLSFKGDPKYGFRQETGVLTRDKQFAKEMLNNLQERIYNVKNNTKVIF